MAGFARSPPAQYGAGALRNIVYRYDDVESLAHALREGDQELPVPAHEAVGDGEWVLAIFEIGERSTAAAARGLHGGEADMIAFERRDWERLVDFASTTKPSASSVPPDVDTQPSAVNEAPATDTRPTKPSMRAREPSAPSFAHWRRSDPLAQGPSARVLLVDDDRDIREVVGAMLDAVGLAVETATSAEEALERVRKTAYDLMVLDWNLPGMTGIELCRLIRKDASLSTLPVLFLTAHASSRDVVDAFAVGADDYVVKPFRAPELGARIFGLLRRARMAAAAP
jgi:two-component system phosphate regulon response regulator PhoB